MYRHRWAVAYGFRLLREAWLSLVRSLSFGTGDERQDERQAAEASAEVGVAA